MDKKTDLSPQASAVPDLSRMPALIWLSVLVGIAFLIRFRVGYYQAWHFDGCGYIMHAWSLYEGRLITPYWAKGVANYYQPLYPLLVSICYRLIPNWYRSGVLVNNILGALLLVPVYLLGKRVYGRVGGLFAATLLVAQPLLAGLGSNPSSEPAFLLFAFFGIYFFHRLLEENKLKLGIAAGAFFGLSYLSRAQAAVFIPAAAFSLFWLLLRKKTSLVRGGQFLALILVSFYIVALPYDFYCAKKDGVWGLRFRQEFFKKTVNPHSMTWHINESSTDRDALMPANFRLALEQSPLNYAFSRPGTYAKVVISELKYSLANSFKNGGIFSPFMVALLLLSLLAYLLKLPRSELMARLGIYLAWILVLTIAPALTAVTTVRYYAGLIPLFGLFAAGGLISIKELSGRVKALKWLNSNRLLWLWPLILLLLFPKEGLFTLSSKREQEKRNRPFLSISDWLKTKVQEPGKIVMAKNPCYCMGSGSYWYLYPLEDPMRLIRYAQHQEADYLLVTNPPRSPFGYPPRYWSEYLRSPVNKPGLEYVDSYSGDQGQTFVVLYKVEKPKPLNQRPPSIALVLIDSLRPDHIRAFGYGRAATPNLDRIAKSGFAFINTVAASIDPGWSMLSILNSAYLEVPMFISRKSSHQAEDLLPLDLDGMAEFLKARGYKTAAFIDFYYPPPAFQLIPLSGFDLISYSQDPQAVSDWIAGIRGNEPFFLCLRIDLERGFREALERKKVPAKNPGQAQIEQAVSIYDAQLQAKDKWLGRIVDALSKIGKDGRGLFLIISSERGVQLGERGSILGPELHREVSTVPVIFSWPGKVSGGKVNLSRVRSIDIVPTILDYAGLEYPSQTQGVSLRPVMESGITLDLTALTDYVPEAAIQAREFNFQQALRTSSILYYSTGTGAAIFDLARDPTEDYDLATSPKLSRLTPSEQSFFTEWRNYLFEAAHDADFYNLRHLQRFHGK